MRQHMVYGAVRHSLTLTAGSLFAHSYITYDQVQAAVAALMTIGAIAWSVLEKWLDRRNKRR